MAKTNNMSPSTVDAEDNENDVFFDAEEGSDDTETQTETSATEESSTWSQSFLGAAKSVGYSLLAPLQLLAIPFTGDEDQIAALDECIDSMYGQRSDIETTSPEVEEQREEGFMDAATIFLDAMNGNPFAEDDRAFEMPGDATMHAALDKVAELVTPIATKAQEVVGTVANKVTEIVAPAATQARGFASMLTELPQRLYHGVMGALVAMAAVAIAAAFIPVIGAPILFNIAMIAGFYRGFASEVQTQEQPVQVTVPVPPKGPSNAAVVEDSVTVSCPGHNFVEQLGKIAKINCLSK